MTDYTPSEATDYRRAAALLAHWTTRSTHGIHAVLQEVDNDPRIDATLGLLVCVMDLAVAVSPALREPDAADRLRSAAVTLAGLEEQPC